MSENNDSIKEKYIAKPIENNKPEFQISDSAAKRINVLAKKENDPENSFLRIKVLGGGCSGFQYDMDFDTKTEEGDHVFEYMEAKVVIDDVSIPFINGACIDYVESLVGAAFEIKNPNATASCGCGNSFSV